MYFSKIFYKKGLALPAKKHSWHASKMADNLSFQITYSSMMYRNRHLGTPNSDFNGCHCMRDPVLYRSMVVTLTPASVLFISLTIHACSKRFLCSCLYLMKFWCFVCPISLSHGRYFRQFWGTATFTSESLHTARCNSLYL